MAGRYRAAVGVSTTLRRDVEELMDRLLAAARRPQMGEEQLGLLDRARAAQEASRRRRRIFGSLLQVDPAWHILLALLIADIEERPVTVSAACAAAGAPTTTALRHIERLSKLGLIRREANPKDGRSFFLGLTPEGGRMMRAYFATGPTEVKGSAAPDA